MVTKMRIEWRFVIALDEEIVEAPGIFGAAIAESLTIDIRVRTQRDPT